MHHGPAPRAVSPCAFQIVLNCCVGAYSAALDLLEGCHHCEIESVTELHGERLVELLRAGEVVVEGTPGHSRPSTDFLDAGIQSPLATDELESRLEDAPAGAAALAAHFCRAPQGCCHPGKLMIS